jgi:hypothetical protein
VRLLPTAALAFALALAPRGAHAVDVHHEGTLTQPQRAAAHALASDVLPRLPTRWREALGPRVELHWRDDLPPGVHGRTLPGRVLLRRSLLDAPPSNGTPHPAAAALVHELAHVLDRGRADGLSRDPRLLDLGGWQRGALAGRKARTTYRDRSPDPYEATNPREFVAVNLEHFVLDPEYACRRPALARHFAARLGTTTPARDCAPGQVFVQADSAPAETSPLVGIDASRVAGVDVLLAEPAAAVMSRWGHVMLRLVVCAPGRAPGPDCRLDLAHHRVLSFRAFVDDVQVSGWRGLVGSYPSRLFVLPLSQVVDEYTKVELRGLRSVPLRLSKDEVEGLLEQASQVHWSHDGRYRFVTDNCATETWRLLRDGVPRLGALRLASLTPTGLVARLERSGVADASVLADRGSALARGHYFESQATQYRAMFEAARASLPLPARDVQAWLDMPPRRRAPWIAQADLRAAAALLVLEGAALRRAELRARDAVRRRLAKAQAAPAGRGDALEALRIADRLTRPAALLPGGYGLPQQREREQLARDAVALAAQWREASARLHARARDWLPRGEREALEASESNLAQLGARIRTLHRQAGGMELGREGQ